MNRRPGLFTSMALGGLSGYALAAQTGLVIQRAVEGRWTAAVAHAVSLLFLGALVVLGWIDWGRHQTYVTVLEGIKRAVDELMAIYTPKGPDQ